MRVAFVTLGSIQGVMSDLQEKIHDIKRRGSDDGGEGAEEEEK